MTEPPAAAASGPLAGVRVLDLATVRAELAGRILADLGAEVVKVEPPEGAEARRLPPFLAGREHEPDGSLYWAAVALGKRSVVLDLAGEDGREKLRNLIADADVLVESFDPGTLDALGLGYETLRGLNPSLIYVSVTPFGGDGPEAHSPAAPITVEAAGGLVGLQGDGDRPPIPIGYPQAWFHAGAQAAADAIIALYERNRSGLGQRLDVSAQAAMVWTLMNATGFPPNTGGDPPGTGEQRTEPEQVVPGVSIRHVWPCKDGYVRAMLGSGSGGGRTIHGLMRLAAAAGMLPEALRGIDWRTWVLDVQGGRITLDQVHAMIETAGPLLLTQTKREWVETALREDVLVAPIQSVADVLADPQLQARDYWHEAGGRLHPGSFARLSRTPVRLGGPAPALGAGPAPTGRPAHLRPAPPPSAPSTIKAGRERAFTGLKVADFSWVGVGPLIAKALADNGATVVHVESAARPDTLRNGAPMKDGTPGIDRSQFFADFNSSKLGLALNLAQEEGRRVARRLAGWADVVLESFTAGTVARLGLDYATLSRGRTDLVMLSTCLRGQTGPEAGFAGFGQLGQAFAGLHGITGWPDRPPAGPWGAGTDFIAPRYGVAALAAALHDRQRTGLGQYIDLGQVEAAIHFLEPLVLDYTVNGRVAGPAGHESLYACPHGVYQTAGIERYVAIAVETAAHWRALLALAPLDAFAGPALDDLQARIGCRQELERVMQRWTRDQDPWELARRLKDAGVPAYVVLRPSDLYHDAQLTHRGFFVTLDHGEMGPTPYDGPATRFSATANEPWRAAPCLGQHTEHVLRDLLGLAEDEVTALAIAGVLS